MRSSPRAANMLTMGVDVGGTTTRVALVDSSGRVTARTSWPTVDRAQPAARLTRDFPVLLAQSIRGFIEESGSSVDWVDRIALAAAGLLADHGRAFIRCVNLPFVEGIPLADDLEAALQSPVVLLTDIQAAAWAEWTSLVPPPKRFVHLRFGTGVGCALIVDGQFVDLPRSDKGHPDVLIVEDADQAKPCRCGQRGCLEAYASGRVLLEVASQLELPADLRAVQQALEGDEAAAIHLIDLPSQAIKRAIERISEELEPDVIVLGGGVVNCFPALVERALELLPEEVRGLSRSANLAEEAGVIGAALLAQRDNGS